MKSNHLHLKASSLLLALAASACATGEDAALGDSVTASFSLSQTTTTASALLMDERDRDTLRIGGARIRFGNIDSLIVDVTRVDVLPDSVIRRCHPPVGDSVMGFRPGNGPIDIEVGPPMGPGRGRGPHGCRPRGPRFDGPPPFGPRPDTLIARDTGWGSRPDHWYSLNVVGSGQLDLLALPTDSGTGLLLASGVLPVGDYGAARLIVASAQIWFDTTFTTTNGFTFEANTAYRVKLPMLRDSSGMFIMTREGFSLDEAGRTVLLTFDPFVTIGGAGVNAAGEIVIRPVLAPHRPRH